MRLEAKQFPIFEELTELEYIYYSVGFFIFNDFKNKQKNDYHEMIFKFIQELVEYFQYEIVDIKTLILDADGFIRGQGGVKHPFNPKDLPSYKHRHNIDQSIQVEPLTGETDEERLKRHREFFETLKRQSETGNNKQMKINISV